MDVEAAIASTVNVQEAFRTLTLLQLTYHLFPKPAELSDGDCFDYVIVGGGGAGCVLANRLSEQPGVSVLLLEAGGDPPIESQWPALQTYTLRGYLDWNYTTTPDPVSQRCHKQHSGNIVAGRVLGGGTAISSLYYVRGNPRDYDTWAELLADRNWSWDAVYPYFKKAENLKDCEVLSSSCAKYYGTGGYLGLTRDPDPKTSRYLTAVKELNYSTPLDINGCSFSGFVQQMFMIADGVRQSTAYAYLRPVKDRANLYVVRHATVYEILFDNSNRAIGVKLTKDNKNISVRARKEVILSAGTFNSPQLLMLSGIGPKEHLQELGIRVRKDLPVGFNYQNHVSVFVPFKMDYSRAPLEPTDPRRSPLFTSFVGSVPANGSADRIEYESVNYIVQHDSQDLLQFCGFYHGYKNRLCQILFDECRGRDVMLSCAVMLYPFSRGRVTLRSANIADPPLIDAGILRDERDLELYVNYIEDTLRLVNTTLFRSMNAEVVDLKLEMCEGLELWSKPYIRCFVRCIVATLHHYVGTCAMGSVVDNEMRVRGVSGLRVVDGSVMPREVGGPTTAAVVMLAEKAADIIKFGGHINVNNYCESKNSQYPQHETPQEVEHEYSQHPQQVTAKEVEHGNSQHPQQVTAKEVEHEDSQHPQQVTAKEVEHEDSQHPQQVTAKEVEHEDSQHPQQVTAKEVEHEDSQHPQQVTAKEVEHGNSQHPQQVTAKEVEHEDSQHPQQVTAKEVEHEDFQHPQQVTAKEVEHGNSQHPQQVTAKEVEHGNSHDLPYRYS